MNNPEHDIELIEGYLMNGISAEERSSVEARLVSDASFAQLFKEMEVIVGGIQQATRNELLNQLQQQESEIKKNETETVSKGKVTPLPQPSSKRRLWAPIGIAAGILLLVGLVYFNNPFGPKKNDVLAEFYEPLPSDLVYLFTLDKPFSSEDLKQSAAKALQNTEFDEAIPLLEELIYERNDTSENILRVYSNTLLQRNKKFCKDSASKLDRLKNHISSPSYKSMILLDEILLARKCMVDNALSLSQGINEGSLLDYDAEKWVKIKDEF